MESIPSGVKLGEPSATQGARPVHTAEGHSDCPFYQNSQGMECSHGTQATGAFYNEDYLWDLRTTAHRLISTLRAANLPLTSQRMIMKEVDKLAALTK